MATKKSTANTESAPADDVVTADEKVMYYNDQIPQHPRYHQPGDTDAAADAANTTTTQVVSNDDIKPQPGFLPDPRGSETTKKVADVNEEIASRPDTGDLGDTGK